MYTYINTHIQTDTHTQTHTETHRAYKWLQVPPFKLTLNVGNDKSIYKAVVLNYSLMGPSAIVEVLLPKYYC